MDIRTWLSAIALLAAGSAPAGETFEIRKWTVDGGGERSVGGSFEVTGTLGQHDVGRSTGGSFSVSGGFWASAAPGAGADTIFRDGFEAL